MQSTGVIALKKTIRILGTALSIAVIVIAQLKAVILCGSGDPSTNTSAPAGAFANSGWQWQGNFNGYSGTAIGPSHFLTAHHIGGNVGNPFTFNGVNYTTTAVHNDTTTDLSVWTIQGRLPAWAPLYTGAPGSEVGKVVVVFGLGTERGAEIHTPGTTTVAGWQWGADTRVRRWGVTAVGKIFTDAQYGASLFLPFQCFKNYDWVAAGISNGDSGGGTFVYENGQWYLAGVNLSYDGPFSTSPNMSDPFNATVRIGSGYTAPLDGILNNGPTGPAPTPAGSYATEVAPRMNFLSQYAGK